jgi:hypothetical protein
MNKKQQIYLGGWLLAAVALGMYFHQQPLTNQDVVDMELCFSAEKLQFITAKFSQDILINTFSIHVVYDFFLMLAYVFFLSTWIRYVVTLNISDSWNQAGRWFSNGIYVAGVLDALEDFLMYRTIVLHQTFINWSILSSIKFFLILLGILYLLLFLWNRVYHKKSA